MAHNLDVETFQNGDPIPEAKTVKEWTEAARRKEPAWCYFNNNPANGRVYGKLYNFFAVSDPRGLAPEGWRIPAYDDWMTLGTFLGGRKQAGESLKSTSGWNKQGNGTNTTGFSALPTGCRKLSLINQNDGFLGVGNVGYWWSNNFDQRSASVWTVSMSKSDNRFSTFWSGVRSDGYAVRCVR